MAVPRSSPHALPRPSAGLKSLVTPWNALLGAQYAFDEHWMVRSEFGFIGRYSLLLGFNYRFGLGVTP